MFELNTVGRRVSLTVPAVPPVAHGTEFERETVTTFFPLPLGPKPTEERETQQTGPPLTQVELTDPAMKFGQGSLIFDDPMTVVGGKISNQHTVTATYQGMHLNVEPIAGKLVVKYTLTPR